MFYLRGLAIAAVLVGHYAQYYLTGIYGRWISGYAYGAVAVFFVVGGYTASRSLARRFAGDTVKRRVILRYYFDRAVRIYPLYWLALLLTPFYLPEYHQLHDPGWQTLGIYLCTPLLKAPGVFWFVTAIIQCYLAAPFLYLLLRRMRPPAFLMFNIIMSAALFAASWLYLSTLANADPLAVSNLESLFYKRFLLANVVLFSLGMLAVHLISSMSRRINRAGLAVSFFSFLLLLYLTRDNYSLFHGGAIFMVPLFIISAFAFCACMIGGSPLPLKRIFFLPGRHSYPLFLFHMAFLASLGRLSLIRDNDIKSLGIALFFITVFILTLGFIEELPFLAPKPNREEGK